MGWSGCVEQGAGIEDEGDVAVAEDGRTGDAGQVLHESTEALDDDLLLADHLVDEQGANLAVGLDDDGDAFPRQFGLRGDAEAAVQPV